MKVKPHTCFSIFSMTASTSRSAAVGMPLHMQSAQGSQQVLLKHSNPIYEVRLQSSVSIVVFCGQDQGGMELLNAERH